MRKSTPQFPVHGAVVANSNLDIETDFIEWEDVPSLAETLNVRLINPDLANRNRPIVPSVLGGWEPTMPAELDDTPPPMFHEVFQGLSIREVHEPELFQHFFGDTQGKT